MNVMRYKLESIIKLRECLGSKKMAGSDEESDRMLQNTGNYNQVPSPNIQLNIITYFLYTIELEKPYSEHEL